MSEGGYTPGTSPWFHSLIHTGNPMDARFYASLVRPSLEVLELGSGLGRISFEMAKAKAKVTGLELEPEMIEAARKGAVERGLDNARFIAGDMRSFDMGRRYDLVAAPYNALLCLLTDEDLRACLARVAAHLKTGGVFAFDIYDPGEPIEGEQEPIELEELSLLVSLAQGETEIKVYERALPSRDPRRMDTSYLFETADPSGIQIYEHRLPQRVIYPDEVRDLLAAAGLKLIRTLPDFCPGEIHEDTLQVAFVARKKELHLD